MTTDSATQARAHRLVKLAVTEGLLTRPARCAACKAIAPVHAHHEDYARPFDVEWMCASCHRKRHYAIRVPGEPNLEQVLAGRSLGPEAFGRALIEWGYLP